MKNKIFKNRALTIIVILASFIVLFLAIILFSNLYNYKVREALGVKTSQYISIEEFDEFNLTFELKEVRDVYYSENKKQYSRGYFHYNISVDKVSDSISNIEYTVVFDCSMFGNCKGEESTSKHNQTNPYSVASAVMYFNEDYRWSEEISVTNRKKSCDTNCDSLVPYTYETYDKHDLLPDMYVKMTYTEIQNHDFGDLSYDRTVYIKLNSYEYITSNTNFYY